MTFLVPLQLLLSGSWRSASLENIVLVQVCMSWTWWMSAAVVVVVVVFVVLDCWGWRIGCSGGSLPLLLEQKFVEFSCFLQFYWYLNRLIFYYYFCEVSLWVCECVRSCILVTLKVIPTHNKQITQYWTVCLHSKEKKGCPFNRCIQEAGSAHGTNKGGSEGLVGDISTQDRALTGDCFCNVRLFDANKMASFWRSNIETSSARSGCAMLRVHTWWFSQPLQRATQKSKGQRAAACLVRFVLPTLPFCSRKRPLNC